MSEQVLDVGKTKTHLELIGVVAGVPVTLSFVVGLVVKQVHFAQYGAGGVSLATIEYMKAGAVVEAFVLLFVFAFLVAGVLLHVFSQFVKEHFPVYFFSLETGEPTYDLPRWLKYAGRAFLGILSLSVLGVTLALLTAAFRADYSNDWNRILLLGAAVAVTVWMLIYLLLMEGEYTRPRLAHTMIMVAVCFTFLLGYGAFFSLTVYDRIPSYLWGGQPREVRLILKDDPDTIRFAEAEGVVLREGVRQADNVRLLTETEDGYVFIVDSPLEASKAIFLGRGVVHSIQNASLLP